MVLKYGFFEGLVLVMAPTLLLIVTHTTRIHTRLVRYLPSPSADHPSTPPTQKPEEIGERREVSLAVLAMHGTFPHPLAHPTHSTRSQLHSITTTRARTP